MAHFAQSPSFILHQVTCQFATGDILFGPLNLSLDASVCGFTFNTFSNSHADYFATSC